MANVPNLDCMDRSEYMPFWAKYQSGRNYRDIFPKGGKGTKRAVADLANYASNKHAAIYCREHGWINRATMYENTADSIYSKLPDFAKW